MYFQGTIDREIEFSGIGLHTGNYSRVRLVPAPINTGIIFIPEEIVKNVKTIDAIVRDSYGVKADVKNIAETNNALTIGNDFFRVKTIEHFMAAFYSLGITNLYVIINGEEMPILDGSSIEIIEKIEKAGIRVQNAVCSPIYIPYPVWVENNGSYLIALPSSSFKITYTIDFTSKSSAVGTQTAQFVITPEIFKKEIAPARTFGFYEDIEKLKSYNLAQGGSTENALIFTKDGLINDNLRFDDECVRHKILDLIGDMALLGSRIIAHFIAYKSGHTLDIELVKKIIRSVRRTRHISRIPREVIKKKQIEFNNFRKRINL